jgi:hypothetical protein
LLTVFGGEELLGMGEIFRTGNSTETRRRQRQQSSSGEKGEFHGLIQIEQISGIGGRTLEA